MRTWSYTGNGELITGLNEQGFPYFQRTIKGWNDNHSFSDIEDVVTLLAVVYNQGAELHLQSLYTSEDALSNEMIQAKCEETEQMLLQEVQHWIYAVD